MRMWMMGINSFLSPVSFEKILVRTLEKNHFLSIALDMGEKSCKNKKMMIYKISVR